MVPTRYRPAVAIAVILVANATVWTASVWRFHQTLPGIPIPSANVAAEFLSTSALLLASTNLMLSTRLRPFEDLFRGLDKMYTSHRTNGLVVASIVPLHFLLVPKFTPFGPSGWLALPAITLIVLAVLIAIAPRAPWKALVPLRYQDWKVSHRFMGVLIAMVVTHSLLAHPFSANLPAVRLWVYSVAALGLLAYVYRETLERSFAKRHRYRAASPKQISPDVFEIPLEPVARPIAHRAGQFAFVTFEQGPTHEQHPFTISMAPVAEALTAEAPAPGSPAGGTRPAGPLRFSIKGSGDFTTALQSHVPDGSEVRIEGPYGRFDFTKAGPRQLWLAGGIGITPFLAFAGALDGTRDIRLVWTVHGRAEAIHRNDLQAATETDPRFFLVVHDSTQMGRLHVSDLEISEPETLDVFICGPVPMRKAYVEELTDLGVDRDRIFYEEFTLR